MTVCQCRTGYVNPARAEKLGTSLCAQCLWCGVKKQIAKGESLDPDLAAFLLDEYQTLLADVNSGQYS